MLTSPPATRDVSRKPPAASDQAAGVLPALTMLIRLTANA